MRTSFRVPVMCAAFMAAALGISACGSATVESENSPEQTKVAPLERSPQPASASESASEASSQSADSSDEKSSSESSAASASDEPEDRGAREISAIPSPSRTQGPEQDFLAAVQKAGVKTEGAEDQIIGAGQAACNEGDAVTIPAVAGQLIEQGRAPLSHEELTAVLTDQARGTLCAK
ncbi:hypothetical protein HMPREF3169_00685 [Corynebacterium sp. HMSC08C04]|uniref:DUF732 domain-containing protein n=2 Tax=Corynebacteriaceae TaxID=1653 RepID=UPI0008A19AEC|nr:DUF732 domain-containing protein [Corynebacterium sp. HMSC08C04]OFL99396.1 hypothetical protein HMPREF2724_10730 [Corynebacterium sp. HMSC071F07]OFT36770.1 hypothetical protein HMPREF3169_00685 [Corynebacterium sp. HMSC08C04]OHO66672.1 hypothetical protein HMPREF2692_08045 [Corynebacterium sp. HMSC036D03]